MHKSVADEVREVLSTSRQPKTMREICVALDGKYTSSYVNKHVRYWEKKGVIVSNIKDGYEKIKEYRIC